jgi:hypothetical protein
MARRTKEWKGPKVQKQYVSRARDTTFQVVVQVIFTIDQKLHTDAKVFRITRGHLTDQKNLAKRDHAFFIGDDGRDERTLKEIVQILCREVEGRYRQNHPKDPKLTDSFKHFLGAIASLNLENDGLTPRKGDILYCAIYRTEGHAEIESICQLTRSFEDDNKFLERAIQTSSNMMELALRP